MMEHLLSLSQAKLLHEDLDSRCLRKAVLVQNALRHGAPVSPVAVVPADPMSLAAGPGRLFRTTSSHEVLLDTYQTRGPCPSPREHQPHYMVDVTDEVAGNGVSPPASPSADAMDTFEYGVVPTTAPPMTAYAAQPLLVEHLQAGASSPTHDVIDEEVPDYTLLSFSSGKRGATSQDSYLHYEQVGKRVCVEAALVMESVDWMQ